MQRIIDGKRYNTETATMVADVSPAGFYQGDFRWEDTQLYRTPRGGWFLAGKGGALSRWGRPIGLNGYSGGSGIHVVDEDEARALLERHSETDAIEKWFGNVIVEG